MKGAQTGEKQSNSSILGLFVASLAGIIGLASTRKHRDNK